MLSYTATSGVAVLFPVAMVRGFGAPATLPAAAYAIGVTASLAVYAIAARLDVRHGATATLRLGLLLRAAAMAGMAVFGWFGVSLWPVLGLFAATQCAWPLLNVSSNALAVSLHPENRGESLGLLNAVSSAGSVLGSVAGGAIAQAAGFPALCAVGVIAVIVAAALLPRPR